MEKQDISKELRVLSVGNSFSVDTMTHLANVALSAGVERVCLGNLFVGGCSIKRHYGHAESDAAVYKYYTNNGDEWESTLDVSIRQAIEGGAWDWISIQHGTGDGSCYTDPESYLHLPALVDYIKKLAPQARIAFNMTWVWEPNHNHHEMRAYNGDTLAFYRNLTDLTKGLVASTKGIDLISPTGTAVQNMRTATDTVLTRDRFHLSLGLGRYIAALTFFGALTGIDVDLVSWKPEEVSDTDAALARAAARAAVAKPFGVTDLKQ